MSNKTTHFNHDQSSQSMSHDGPTCGIDQSYENPLLQPQLPLSLGALKDRIKNHYEVCSDYYLSLWGEHIHHGYFLSPKDSKEQAQVQLVELLLRISQLGKHSRVLDVGCGIGGTSRYLAKNMGCEVVGITISGQQVHIGKRLTAREAGVREEDADSTVSFEIGDGGVQFIELDAENLGKHFHSQTDFDCVWIAEAMSHLPDKDLFFHDAYEVLAPGGKLVIADWFRAEVLTDAQIQADIRPIEDGMLLPALCSQPYYVERAREAGFTVFAKPIDISEKVSKTWDISWSLIQNPALWAMAVAKGRDGLAFLQAFRAMRRGYANGTFCYAVMVFQK